MNLFKASWKTTVGGIVTFLALVTSQLRLVFDDLPDTNPDWNLIVAAIGALWLGLASRDNNVTSEEAGAKPQGSPLEY